MPFVVSNKLDATGPVEVTMPNEVATISYNQYMNTVRAQTSFAKSLQNILNEAAHRISHSGDFASAPAAAPASTA